MDTDLISDNDRNIIGMHLTRRVGQLLADKNISLDQSNEIGEFILSKIYTPKTKSEMLAFIDKLQTKWPHFDSMKTIIMNPSVFDEQ